MIPLFKVFMDPSAGQRVQRVLDSGFIGQGPVAEEFEQAFRRYSVGDPVLTNSCTSAIHMALTHIGVGPGDEVITTPLTCVATNAPILALGATPVWADVDPITGLINPDSVGERITERTRAVIGVDWTGRRAPYRALRSFGFPVVQDAAHGPVLRKPGYFCGDYVCYSFGPIKHLTSGDGGAVVMPRGSAEQVEELRLMRWYGLDRKSRADFRCEQNITHYGLKWHMTDLNAAIGMANLPRLMENVDVHRENARVLYSLIRNPRVILPVLDVESNYWVFPVLLHNREERDAFKEWMEAGGVMCSRVHARNDKHEAYAVGPVRDLPGVDTFDDCQANLPCGWWVTKDDVVRIAARVNEFWGVA